MRDEYGYLICDDCGVTLGKDEGTADDVKEHYCTSCSFGANFITMKPKDFIQKGESVGIKYHAHNFVGNQKKTVYFAHPWDKWQSDEEMTVANILRNMGYEVYNPFVQESFLNEKYGVDHYYIKPTIEFAQDIVDRDYKAVSKCDEYFGWFPKGVTTIGTVFELTLAKSMGKKITVMCHRLHPFLWVFADVFYVGMDNLRAGIYIGRHLK